MEFYIPPTTISFCLGMIFMFVLVAAFGIYASMRVGAQRARNLEAFKQWESAQTSGTSKPKEPQNGSKNTPQ